ncbi:MAG: hypothetical protein QM654_18045 [Dysgonamonadaceae bacterium]
MILVLTSELGDNSHYSIIDWLNNLHANYKIISGESILRAEVSFTLKNGCIYCDGINLTENVTCVYYRRWMISPNVKISEDRVLNSTLANNLAGEMHEIKKMLFYNLANATWFPDPKSIIVNKLSILEDAKKIGLNVPAYIVTNNKKELLSFYNDNNKIITKAIGNFNVIKTLDENILNPIYTKPVDIKLIKSLPNKFCPSFFQKNIDKILELRIVYFREKIYTIGILSQDNEITHFDSRNKSEEVECRLVTMDISSDLKKKIKQLMNNLNLNIGSLDFLLDKNHQYYFLEVNPVGQIAGYSERTGYNIEKDIVEYLVSIDNI